VLFNHRLPPFRPQTFQRRFNPSSTLKTQSCARCVKTVLIHVDESKHLVARVDLANKIAISENAHLVGLAFTGI
jgi:hypothetical protein